MRYHPITILFRIYQLVKNNIFLAVILFVFQRDSELWIWKYGKYVFLFFIIWRLLYIITAWFVEKYEWKDNVFHIHRGIFVKHTSVIPFSKVQNVTRKTTLFHKLLGLTSLTFETAMDGEDDAIHFEVLSKKQANDLIDLVQPGKVEVTQKEPLDEDVVHKDTQEERVMETNRTIHFRPKKQDLWKASFTSLSFLAIIPIVYGLSEYVEPLLPEKDQLEGTFERLLNSGWILFAIIILIIIIAVTFGVIRTFIRYGKYEISSDATQIYIHRGVLDESFFAIDKRKVQGIEMNQTFMKRMFGLVEVKLISSVRQKNSEGSVHVNSLYPFLPMERAYQLIEELLPNYELHSHFEKLPRKSLWVKLLRPSWLWIVVTIGLFYFKPTFLRIEQTWWILSLALLCVIVLHRIFDYVHTRYVITGDQVQWWRGGLTSRMYVTKRRNVTEIKYSQTVIQNLFQVASVTTMNLSVPAHTEKIDDIPLPYALAMEEWYLKRKKDVLTVEKVK